MAHYTDLTIWKKNQDCIRLTADLLDVLTRRRSMDIIGKQLFRSITSVGANVAEGQSDFDGNEFRRYCKIAIRSAFESDHWLRTLIHLESNERLRIGIQEIKSINEECIKMLVKLIHSLERKL